MRTQCRIRRVSVTCGNPFDYREMLIHCGIPAPWKCEGGDGHQVHCPVHQFKLLDQIAVVPRPVQLPVKALVGLCHILGRIHMRAVRLHH